LPLAVQQWPPTMQQARAKVRLVGLPTDSHSSFLRGAAQAPAAIRAALASDHSNQASESGLELSTDIIVDDAGDLPLAEDVGDFHLIRNAASSIEPTIFLGGDHMVSYPIVAGLASVHGPLNILHFDAHPDIYDDFGGDPLSHASPFARIMENGFANRLIQVGIRTMNAHCRAQTARFGVEVIEMKDFAPAQVPIPPAPLYISIDLDALDAPSLRASPTMSQGVSVLVNLSLYFTVCPDR
jgi:arginase